ncbi:MAG: hypothetical protein M5U34_31620 [Chloroflexi bacterium]|nr:hypothetical protein [Chloroflexota bacterium]
MQQQLAALAEHADENPFVNFAAVEKAAYQAAGLPEPQGAIARLHGVAAPPHRRVVLLSGANRWSG